jgi:hypothetical protein
VGFHCDSKCRRGGAENILLRRIFLSEKDIAEW